MDDRTREILRHLLGGHAGREHAAVDNFLAGMALLHPDVAPPWVPENTLFHLIHEAQEERGHFGMVMDVLVGLFGFEEGGRLADDAFKRAEEIFPPPPTFLHQAAAMALVDRAGRVGMESMLDCSYAPYANCLRQIVGEERGHGNHGDELLLTAYHHSTILIKPAIEQVLHWAAPTAYRCFGRRGTELDLLGVELGLKSRTAEQNIAAFEGEIAPLLKSLGLPTDMLIRHRR